METCWVSLTVVNSKKVWNLSNVWKNLVCLAFFERIHRISTSGSFFGHKFSSQNMKFFVLIAHAPCNQDSQQRGSLGTLPFPSEPPCPLSIDFLQDSAHWTSPCSCCGVLSQKSPLGSKSCCVTLPAVKADVGFVK